jgi:hypothetical protein
VRHRGSAARRLLARQLGHQGLTALALAHGYDTAFWWIAGILACGAVVAGVLFRSGPLHQPDAMARQANQAQPINDGPVIPA